MTGLRGCFAYVHIADPENGIFESNEDNNEAQAIVRLPYQPSRPRQGCRGRDRGRSFNPNLPWDQSRPTEVLCGSYGGYRHL